MKVLSFTIPVAAALLPQQTKYIEPTIPQQKNDDESIYQDATEEHAILLRKYEDSERFLRFAAHSSHKSHSSHRSHSSGSSNKHSSHTSHSSGSYGTGSTTTNSTKSTNNTTTIKRNIFFTVSASYSADNYINLIWRLDGFSESSKIYIYQDGKEIRNYNGLSTTTYKIENVKYLTTYKFQIKVIDSGKTYWSDIQTATTGSDPYNYDKNSLPVSISELNKTSKKIVNSILDTIELPSDASIFISDFTSPVSYNTLGRETASSIRNAFKSLTKNKIIIASDELNKQMRKENGTKDYLSAIDYGLMASADYVCYGEIIKTKDDIYTIKVKIINISDTNILTEKEDFIPVK